jgi:hypothetical protein
MQLTLQQIKDQVAPGLNLEELKSLRFYIDRRIEDVEDWHRRNKKKDGNTDEHHDSKD